MKPMPTTGEELEAFVRAVVRDEYAVLHQCRVHLTDSVTGETARCEISLLVRPDHTSHETTFHGQRWHWVGEHTTLKMTPPPVAPGDTPR